MEFKDITNIKISMLDKDPIELIEIMRNNDNDVIIDYNTDRIVSLYNYTKELNNIDKAISIWTAVPLIEVKNIYNLYPLGNYNYLIKI